MTLLAKNAGVLWALERVEPVNWIVSNSSAFLELLRIAHFGGNPR